MNITLLQLRAFVAVSRYGSFSLAADALHRTQPAITMQVKQLEDALALKLFDRTTRQLKLTTVGLELFPSLSAMLAQLDATVDRSQDLREKRTGTVRIGCLPSVAATFLPSRIAQFRKSHPGISFSLQDALGDKVMALVKSGDVEFGITDIQADDAALESMPLLLERMCALYLEGHPLDQAAEVGITELGRHDLILMAPGSNARRIVDTGFATQGRVAVAACEAAYMSTAIGMVQAGLGVALLPRGGVALGIDSRLRLREIAAPGFTRQIALVRLKRKTLSPAADVFIRTLAEPI